MLEDFIGAGMRRDVGYVLEVGSPAFVRALEDCVVALMIEKREAVENLEAILSVTGVDMVQFGPADYAMSIGLAGQFDHPKVREAERYVIEKAMDKGIAPRAELAHPGEAGRFVAFLSGFCSVGFFCLSESTIRVTRTAKSVDLCFCPFVLEYVSEQEGDRDGQNAGR